MATTTKIEWADKTWSPIIGCDRVSPGCDRCYAMSTARIREFNPNPKISTAFAGTTLNDGNGVDWSGKVNLLDDRLTQPLSWKKPVKIFVNSMSDLFHKDIPDEYIAKVFAVMALTPQHTYQILTKRHGRMRSLLGGPHKVDTERGYTPGVWFRSMVQYATHELGSQVDLFGSDSRWPLPNVWLGVSVEDQKRADLRIPALVDTPAAVRFLSCEPLLGPVDLSAWMPAGFASWRCQAPKCRRFYGGPLQQVCPGCGSEGYWTGSHTGNGRPNGQPINWVIVGGESGHGARAMHPDWARQLRDQAAAADVPFLFKQWGEWGPAGWVVRVCDPNVGWLGTKEELAAAKASSEATGATHAFTGNWHEEGGERKYELYEPGHKPWSLERVGLPDGSAGMRRWGKKRAGRELDGRTWDEFPTGGAA